MVSQPSRLIERRLKRSPIRRILLPFQEFARIEAASGMVLLACTAVALIWANSPWRETYHSVWQTHLGVRVGDFVFEKSLHYWINDGLMAIFFFIVGLEIKREILVGELASVRRALLPITAALGGMLAPAAIYAFFNVGKEGAHGWGVPMATDIAFAIGAMALLGKRIPTAVKVFLTALAIVDDIGAVLVIAVFYTADLAWAYLAWGGVFLLLLLLCNRLGVRHPLVYLLFGAGLWLMFLYSGVHATIAGVLAAMTIPARNLIDSDEFLEEGRMLLDHFEFSGIHSDSVASSGGQQAAVVMLETACENVETPMQRLEHSLHPWVTFFIMPVFALSNAGVTLEGGHGGSSVNPLFHSVGLGILFGLVFGKQIGIFVFSLIAVRLNIAVLPKEVTWPHIYGAACLGGIGFTMSLFIANLAFEGSPLLLIAKVSILSASAIAGVTGFVFLTLTSRSRQR